MFVIVPGKADFYKTQTF